MTNHFFKIEFKSMQDRTATTMNEVQEKEIKDVNHRGELLSIHSRLKDILNISQRKAFCSQRIPEFRCARKETVDIISFISFHYILTTSRNGDRKIMQPIRITSGPTKRRRKWNHFIQCR